jgi:hypothetical protein
LSGSEEAAKFVFLGFRRCGGAIEMNELEAIRRDVVVMPPFTGKVGKTMRRLGEERAVI